MKKLGELAIILRVRSMGVESLSPDEFEDLLRVLSSLCKVRELGDLDKIPLGAGE